jgi:two-component system, OmpR family, phosphate regulon sensor histidine kinase PhoR
MGMASIDAIETSQ